MLFYQMSRMCREKGAVKHDDRLDCLAQGVQYLTDCMAISANEAIKDRKREEWDNMLADFIQSPHRSANHLVLGMTRDQIAKANAIPEDNTVYTWV